MDLDMPRPSQDGRVYWDSGPNDLLAQLRKTSIQTTPASTRLKRTSIYAGLPSPTRPGAASPSDTSLTSNTSFSSTDTASTSSAASVSSASSSTGSRFGKRRRGAQGSRLGQQSVNATMSTSSSPDKGINEAALRRINEITNLLSMRNKQQQQGSHLGKNGQPQTFKAQGSGSAGARPTALGDKTSTSNMGMSSSSLRKEVATVKPPLPTSRTSGPQHVPAKSTSAATTTTISSSASSSSTARPSSLSRPATGSTFGRSQSAQADVLGSRPTPQTSRGIRSSPPKAPRPISFPIDSTRAKESTSPEESSGDVSLQDDSFDLALGSMAVEDFDAMLQSASQQASSFGSSQLKRRETAAQKRSEQIVPLDITGPPRAAAPQPQSRSRHRSPVQTVKKEPTIASSQQKLRAPFKAPSKIAPSPAALPQQRAAAPATRASHSAVPMIRVKNEPAAPASVEPEEGPSPQSMHPEVQAALEAGIDFSADDGDLSF